MRKSPNVENEAALEAANFIAASARTAPKTRGIDNIEIVVMDDDLEKAKLIRRMEEIGLTENRSSFRRDAASIQTSPVMVIVGVRSNPAGLNCGFCGYKTCDELKKSGGICAYNSIDLGIAISSAVSVAVHFHIDNRIMYSIGKAATELGLFSKDVRQALGIPLSVTGKNPYFDRK